MAEFMNRSQRSVPLETMKRSGTGRDAPGVFVAGTSEGLGDMREETGSYRPEWLERRWWPFLQMTKTTQR
ncbi:MAG TPA: hypothetical protein DCP71_00860 [Verrucomicrobiales bacterium]|nr:hypothetical protein [Verrucomicrobiales bacterium]